MRTSLQAYQRVSVNTLLETVSPHKVITMLLQGAVERLIQAKGALQQGNITVKGEKIGKASAIIYSLRDCLSMEEGGEIAVNLDNIYEFMARHLIEANQENNPDKIELVVSLLREIQSAWIVIPIEHHFS